MTVMEDPAQIIVPIGTMNAPAPLPQPTGYRLLVRLPPKNEKAGEAGLLYKPQESTSLDQQFTLALQVMGMGADCYSDTTRFPSGPLCKVGDWIQTKGALEGSNTFKVAGYEDLFRYIDDDQVAAVLSGPEQVKRV